MDLRKFVSPLSPAEREDFAERCETTWGHLKNVVYGFRPCSESLAINIDRESKGAVTCEELCPGVDWAHVRGSSSVTTRKSAGR
jgi:DNA-binding transcriptional regulator YdaS (Cro superfamily)